MSVSSISAPAALAHIKPATPPLPPPAPPAATKVDADHHVDGTSSRGKTINVKA